MGRPLGAGATLCDAHDRRGLHTLGVEADAPREGESTAKEQEHAA